MLSFPELLQIITNSRIPLDIRVPFTKFLLWAYINISKSAVEIGAEELSHDRSDMSLDLLLYYYIMFFRY
jgi:hypothetical protein